MSSYRAPYARRRRTAFAVVVAAVIATAAIVVSISSLGSSGVPGVDDPASTVSVRLSQAADAGPAKTPGPRALPADSGTGRRAVFDQAEQRVWIVAADGHVRRTYLVSGSLTDNLRPGTYHVYSRSRWAVGIDDTGVMQWFVRFAYGTDQGASIGFHSIPTHLGRPLQKVSQLGTPQSDGCIRQRTGDAIAMWHFGHIGTKVVVVAA